MSTPTSSNSPSLNPAKIAGVILAAGESRRMGRDKALLPLGEQSFLEHLAATLDGEVDPLLVVLGHHADKISQQVRLPGAVEILRNPDYHLGQLSSLKVALRRLVGRKVEGVLVCLVDHPAVTKQVVRALRSSFEQSSATILIPTWRGRRGHPVLFSHRLFQELLDAPMEQGARVVVHRHPEDVALVEVEEEGILWDVDRPEDYAALQSRWAGISRAAAGPSEEHA